MSKLPKGADVPHIPTVQRELLFECLELTKCAGRTVFQNVGFKETMHINVEFCCTQDLGIVISTNFYALRANLELSSEILESTLLLLTESRVVSALVSSP